MPQGILQGHEEIHNRLKFPNYIFFPNRIEYPNDYIMYVVDEDDIPFVLPALFIWVDTGQQSLTYETTPPSHVKFLDFQICNVPTIEFQKKEIGQSAIFMLSPDLRINRNFLTQAKIDSMLDNIKPYPQKFKDLFTGERRNG